MVQSKARDEPFRLRYFLRAFAQKRKSRTKKNDPVGFFCLPASFVFMNFISYIDASRQGRSIALFCSHFRKKLSDLHRAL